MPDRAGENVERGPVFLVSDCTDVAYVEMRQAIQVAYAQAGGQGSALARIEPLVPCSHYSVRHASFLLRLLAEGALPGAILMVINNPLQLRTERIFGSTPSGLFFEGTNTGALGWLVKDFGCDECFELADPGFIPFGGKAVHAPAVARFLAGASPQSLGRPFAPQGIRGGRPQSFELLHIDNFGNGKLFAGQRELSGISGEGEVWLKTPRGPVLRCRVAKRMMECADGDWVIYEGSSMNLLEIGQVRGRGLLDVPAEVGDILEVVA